jgi:Polyketide cyclase / dehydrase and lipid transport
VIGWRFYDVTSSPYVVVRLTEHAVAFLTDEQYGQGVPVSVCPMAVVEAPIEQVWDLLTSPEQFDSWTDATLVSAEPPGRAHAGQHLRLVTSALGRAFRVDIGVLEADAERRCLHLLIHLPFGLVNDETITIAPVGEDRTIVRFG